MKKYILLFCLFQCSYSKVDLNNTFFVPNILCTLNSYINITFNKNLVCNNSVYVSPISFAFPASSYTKNLPSKISMITNNHNNNIFVTTNKLYIKYTEPFPIYPNTILQYYSSNKDNVDENINIEKYTQNILIPHIDLINLTKTFVNKDNFTELTFSTDVSENYKIYLKGRSFIINKNDKALFQGQTMKDTAIKINIYGKDLIEGTNKIILQIGEAYTSFYIYRDDIYVSPIVSIKDGFYNHDLKINITTLEDAQIRYSITDNNHESLFNEYTEPILLTTDINTYHTFILKIISIDIAGNVSPPIFFKYVIDKEIPKINIHFFDTDIPYALSKNNKLYLSSNKKSERNILKIDWDSNEDVEYSFETNSTDIYKGTILEKNLIHKNIILSTLFSGSKFIEGSSILTLYAKDKSGNIATKIFNIYIDNKVNIPHIIQPLIDDKLNSNTIVFNLLNIEKLERDNQESGIDYYELEIATNHLFVNSQIISPLYIPTHTEQLVDNKIYYIRSRAKDNVGNFSLWSAFKKIYINVQKHDLNSGGKQDIAIAATNESFDDKINAGRVYIYFGENIQNPLINLNANIIINGENSYDNFGYSISFINDINNGGVDDVLIGAPNADPNYISDAGKSYIFLGETLKRICTLNPCIIEANHADFILSGEQANDHFGETLSYAGDINNDSYSDFIIGAPNADHGILEKAGRAYLYKGGEFLVAPLVFGGHKSSENFSSCLSYLGDVNLDSYGDFIIGASQGDYSNHKINTGVAYIYLGKEVISTKFDIQLKGAEHSNANFGFYCSRGYDLNSDGFEDILVSAPFDSSITNLQGSSYLYYGKPKIIGVPDIPFLSGQPSSLLGKNILVSNFSSSNTYDIFLGALGTGTFYQHITNNTLCTPSEAITCTSITPNAVSNANILTHGIGKLSNIYNKDILLIGNATQNKVYLYYERINIPPIYTINGNANSNFGFTISKTD